jgi:NTP pyrophosphatase (non-canonical NTP hydrolase)
LKIAGEAGEVADKVGKLIRDHHSQLSEPKRLELLKELGDVLWYVSAIAYELDSSLEAVADLNFAKLEDRKARGVLGGDGDNR